MKCFSNNRVCAKLKLSENTESIRAKHSGKLGSVRIICVITNYLPKILFTAICRAYI